MTHVVATRTVRADAKDRAFRTLIQGLGIDVLVATAAFILVVVPDMDFSSGEAWSYIGASLAKTIVIAVASYIMRLKVQPGSGA